MVNLKTKTPKFLSVNGEMQTGGAPIYADDIIRVQDNDQADILNHFESNRRLLPELLTWDGATQSKQFENGLIISGLEYDNTDPANPVVSEGYIFSDGEVCYYPGGTIPTGLINRGLLYLYKGGSTNTSRTFNVGGSKDILVTHNIAVEVGAVTGNGLELDGSTAITATDEVVVLGIGIPGSYIGEDYFSSRAANKINELGKQVQKASWSSVTLAGSGSLGIHFPYIVSRVNPDGTTDLKGGIRLPGSIVGSSVLIANASTHNVNTSTGAAVPSVGDGFDDPNTYNLVFFQSGNIIITAPASGFPVGPFELIINVNLLGSISLDTPYDYKEDYLNIT